MIEVFMERAEQLARARELVRDDSSYASATALLSVHSAIAMSDALLIHLTGKRGKDPNHQTAAKSLARACSARKLDQSGMKHLRNLLAQKTPISYGEASVSFDRAGTLATASQRFEKWAYELIGETE